MRTPPATFDDLSAPVIAVPPPARNVDLWFSAHANAALVRHLEAAGVTTLLYGGHAHFYNIGLYEHAQVLEADRALGAIPPAA